MEVSFLSQEIDLARPGESRVIQRVMSVDGWRKGLDPSLAARDSREPSVPSRSAVVPTEPRVPVAAPVSPAINAPLRPREPSRPEIAPLAAAQKATPATAKPASPALADFPRAAVVALPPDEDSVQSGTSPSQVAEAMGRMIEEALRGVPAERAAPSKLPSDESPKPGLAQTAPPPREWNIHDATPNRTPGEGAAQTLAEMKAAKPVPPSVAPDEAQAPTARGTLGATPLAHVLVYMLDHALTGSIVFREPDDLAHILHFQLGAVSKVQIARPSSRIGDELVAAGLVSRATINEAVEGARRLGVLLGEYLVGHDLVARSALSRALETQIASRVSAIVNLQPETTYSFYRDVDSSRPRRAKASSVILSTSFSPPSVWHDRARIRATLAASPNIPLIFHTQSDPSNLELTAEERR